MTTPVPESETTGRPLRQVQAAAAIEVRPWFVAHFATVWRTLVWFGVTEEEDLADLTQDVFFASYTALVRGEQIENPRAWLRSCARKHASNYRHKARRRSPHIGGDLLVYGKDPEQITSDRERLEQALAALTEDEEKLVFALRVKGVSWGEAAQERGITIDQARHIYQRAISQIDKALFGSKEKKLCRGAQP